MAFVAQVLNGSGSAVANNAPITTVSGITLSWADAPGNAITIYKKVGSGSATFPATYADVQTELTNQ